MAKTVQEVNQKEINLAQELYIHYHKQSYLDYKNKNIEIDMNWGLISSIYGQDAAILRKRMGVIENITNKDGKSLVEALGTINDLNGNSNTLNEIEKKVAIDVTELIRNGIGESTSTSYALKQAATAQQQIGILDNYIKYIHEVISAFEKGNEDYMKYILDQYQGDAKTLANINSLFSMGNKLNLLAINKTAITSFQTLKERVSQLEAARNSLKVGSKPERVQYKNKTFSYDSLIYPMHYLFSNILGGLGEGLGASFAIKSLNEFLQTLESEDMTVDIEGTGTEKIEGGSTKKADYTISVDNENGSINLSFGISAKAQAINKGRKVTTTFETTKLKTFFDKYIQADNFEKYIFYNNLYHGLTSTAEMQYLRRKYAAMALLDAITGSNQGENVLFLQYLDSLVKLDEFFESLAGASKNQLPALSVIGANKIKTSNDFITRRGDKLNELLKTEGYTDLNPESKSLVAWVRSRQTFKTLNELVTQIQYVHE